MIRKLCLEFDETENLDRNKKKKKKNYQKIFGETGASNLQIAENERNRQEEKKKEKSGNSREENIKVGNRVKGENVMWGK